MGSIRLVFLGVLVSLILPAVLIPSTGARAADAQEQLSGWCSVCHTGHDFPGENIGQKIKFYSDSGIPRYKVHAGLETAALVLDLLGALFMSIVAVWALFFWALYALKCLLKIPVQPLHEISPLLTWFLRALNLLIAAEIIGSIRVKTH
jgi:hypothetical protein